MKFVALLFFTVMSINSSILMAGLGTAGLGSRAPFNEPIPNDVVILKESDGGVYFSRIEISLNGKVVNKIYDLVSPVTGEISVGPVESRIWKLNETTSYPSLTPKIVETLLKAQWLTDKEKEEYKDMIKPKVIVSDKPACDSVDEYIKLKKMTTGEFVSIYKFTANCGEIHLKQFSDSVSTPTIRSIFDLLEALIRIEKF